MALRTRNFFFFFFFSALNVFAQSAATDSESFTVFVGVNVIPMTHDTILQNQTVIVAGEKISEIGPGNQIRIPKEAKVIDAKGKYLVPGLTDSHAHLPNSFLKTLGYDEDDISTWNEIEYDMFLFIANGITSVRSMRGSPYHFQFKDSIESGKWIGPTLFLASPAITYDTAYTTAKVRKDVIQYKKDGYDLIKLVTGITPEIFDTMMTVSREMNIMIAGHLPKEIGLNRAVASHFSCIEHLMGYAALINKDTSNLAELAVMTRDAGIYNCPTIDFYKCIWESNIDNLLKRNGAQYYDQKKYKELIDEQKKSVSKMTDSLKKVYSRVVSFRYRLIKALNDNGAKLLVSGANEYTALGFETLYEMYDFAEAGLSPYNVLRAATRNFADYFNKLNEFGTIEKGKCADLVLLDANPMDDIHNVEKINGVVLKGKWYSHDFIEKKLKDIEVYYANKN